MPTVIFNGEAISCTTAIKGTNFIHLLNESGAAIASFDNVVDFSAFIIQDGSWTTAAPDNECPIAVIRPGGAVTSCDSLVRTTMFNIQLINAPTMWDSTSGGVYKKSFTVAGLKDSDTLLLLPLNEAAWARGAITTEVTANKLTIAVAALPVNTCNILVIRLSSNSVTTASEE